MIKPQAVESSSGCRGDGATHTHRPDDIAGSVRNGEPTTTDTDDVPGLDRSSNRRTGHTLGVERGVRERSAVLADESGDAVGSVLHGTSLVVALAEGSAVRCSLWTTRAAWHPSSTSRKNASPTAAHTPLRPGACFAGLQRSHGSQGTSRSSHPANADGRMVIACQSTDPAPWIAPGASAHQGRASRCRLSWCWRRATREGRPWCR